MTFEEFRHKYLPLIEAELEQWLPPENTYPEVIHAAMRYSAVGAGKRLRGLLVLAAAEMVAGRQFSTVQPAAGLVAAAVEMIHSYSLIHDDLPCMDDDDYRRGKLANHKVFGEGMAVLAGDALLTEAFLVLSRLPDRGVSPGITTRVIGEIAAAAGSRGLIGGQVVDLESEGKTISRQTLEYIHIHKTGALFRAALRCGALVAAATPQQLGAVSTYADYFGLCFQITDDILDVVGEEEKLGKKVGSDAARQKATYVSLYGLEEARRLARKAMSQAKAAIAGFGAAGCVLNGLADFVLSRDH